MRGRNHWGLQIKISGDGEVEELKNNRNEALIYSNKKCRV